MSKGGKLLASEWVEALCKPIDANICSVVDSYVGICYLLNLFYQWVWLIGGFH